MTESTTSTVLSRDRTPLLARHWKPEATPWATIVLIHGIAEHSGRYERVGCWLADAGLEVIAFDLRGFGGSGGPRAWVDRWSRYHDDLADEIGIARAGVGHRPVVLFGHSLGGLLALGYCVSVPPRPLPDALVVSAPAVESSTPGWQRALAAILTRVAPRFEVKNAFDGTVLSRDPGVGVRYLADPLNYHLTTARLGAEALAEQARVRREAGSRGHAGSWRLSIPTLVYHGEADTLVPTVTSEPLAAIPAVTRRTYPNLRHESHNEPEGAAVIGDVIDWLRTTLA